MESGKEPNQPGNPGETPKRRRLAALSNARGVIAALALDHRGSLLAIMEAAAGGEVRRERVEEFKLAVARVFAPQASAVLLDLEYGVLAMRARGPRTGLMMPYEIDAYRNPHPEKLPSLIPGLSVKQMKERDAEGVKMLLHYTPSGSAEINAQKKALVERVGAECRDEGMPFFLELVGYLPGGAPARELARAKPQIVAESIAEFTQDRYGVDVLKVEFPVDLRFVEGARSFAGTALYSRPSALEFFRRAGEATSKPFIYLSGGASVDEFLEGLAMAQEAGAPYSGMLGGRAIWQEGARIYAQQGIQPLERWLATEGERNLERVNHMLVSAISWRQRFAEPAPAPSSNA